MENKLTFTGKVIWVGKRIDGISKTSGKTWSMMQIAIEETESQYPQKMCGTIFGEDKIAAMNPSIGEVVTAHLSLDARSYTDKEGVDRGSTEIRIWKMERVAQTPIQQSLPIDEGKAGASTDNLPF